MVDKPEKPDQQEQEETESSEHEPDRSVEPPTFDIVTEGYNPPKIKKQDETTKKED